MDEIDLDKAREFLDKKMDFTNNENLKLWIKANEDFKKIVDVIIKKYHPKYIYQWGSLLNKDQFTDWSDIDIAIEGCFSPETFFCIYDEANSLTEFELDLVELSKIEPLHAESIKRKGRLVYEQKNCTA